MLALSDSIANHQQSAEISLVAADKECEGLVHAQKRGLNTICMPYKGRPKSQSEAAMIAAVKESQAEWVILAGFMRILSAEFVAEFKDKIINIHPSLLPLYKGLDTHRRALENQDNFHGATVHIVTPTLDDGPILLQGAVPILSDDTPDSLAQRLLPVEHWLYQSCVIGLATGALTVTDGQAIWQKPPSNCPENAKVTICNVKNS